MQCLKAVCTSDVEEAWQEAVPERTHLIAQTFVDLQRFSVESNMFLLTDSEQRPASSSVRQPFIGISEQRDEAEEEETWIDQERNTQLRIDQTEQNWFSSSFSQQ